MGMIRPYLCGTASALCLMLAAAPGWAQQPAGGTAPGDALEEIVITGIRGSLLQSLSTKRNADAIVDAITAEDIGKFPDKNVAESLSKLPGITVDRDFGEGERVAIRGTDPALNRTLLNGQTVASTDWFILDAPGRTFNYTVLAPEVVGRLEVYKSPEARIDEGSIGGTVILHTRKPLDLDPLTLSASIEYGYNDRAEKGAPNASGLVSWKNEDSTLGVLLSATHQEQDLRRDGFESLGYPTVTLPGGGTAIMPNVINAALFQQKRERTGGTATVQAVVDEALELEATGLYVKGTYDNFNQSRYYFNNFRGLPQNPQIRNGVVVGGTYANAGSPNAGLMLLDAIARESEIETWSAHGKAKYNGDGWFISGEVGKTRSTGGTQQQYFGEWEQLTGYSFDISGAPDRIATVTPQFSPTSATGVTLGFAQLRRQPTSDEEVYAQADAGYDLEDLGPLKQIQFGVKYRDHDTTQGALLRRVNGANTPLAGVSGGPTPGGFLDGIDVGDALKNWLTVDEDLLKQFFNTRPANGFVDAAYFDFLPAQFAVAEQIWGGYTQVNLEGDNYRGNFGLRVVHTEQESTGRRDRLGGIFGPPIVPANQIVPIAVDNSYTDWLPSANFSFDVTDDIVLRLAASKVMARANYADLSTYLEQNNTLLTASGGNPQLDPYRANNFDVSVEWYPDRLSMLAATVFFKDISNYIYRATSTESLFNPETGTTNPDGPDFDDFAVSRPRNGGSAEVKGFELIYQGDLYEGFGVQASYTFSDSSTSDPTVALPFSSKHSATITPYYENDLFSARVTYSYRSKYFREVNRATSVINDSYTQLDASLTVNLTDQVALTAQAQNLLDETQYQYVGNETVPFAAYRNGRRFFAGMRFTY
ncbi:MAG: hypothetical protein RLY86_939 [Pseudomonadota bacterium]|jgi:iron complex outermembrane receptor protein